MAESKDLVWLLHQLRNTPQPRERLRLLALGWRTLKDLHPSDRLRIARELGIDGAERLVEELSRRGGVSPSSLLGAMRAARSVDRDDVQELVHGLLDPTRRLEAADEVVDRAASWMLEGADDESLELSSDGERSAGGQQAAERTSTLRAALDAAARDAQESGRQLRRSDDDEHPDRDGETVADRPAIAVPVEPAPPPPPPRAQSAAGRPDRTPAPTPVASGREQRTARPVPPAMPSRPEPPAAAPPPRAAADALVAADESAAAIEALQAEPTQLGRLRRLAALVRDLPDLDAAAAVRMLEAFRSGWARRRALVSMIAAGLPQDPAAVIEVAATLPVAERLWALTELAERDLDDGEWRQLMAAAGGRLIERRLAARRRRAV